MADTLSSEQMERFQEHLKKFDLKPCPVCGTEEWETEGLEATPSFRKRPDGFFEMAVTGTQKVVPKVTISCKHCGYLMSFAWIVVGRNSGG